MDDDTEPKLVISGRSGAVLVDGMRFRLDIYRAEDEPDWILEVVDAEGTSHVWDDRFASDRAARETALATIRREGARSFMHGDNVIPFPRGQR